MFHELTDKEVARRRRLAVIGACVAVAVIVAAWAIVGVVQANARTQGAVALRDSILTSAKQCCAIEGTYPTTLEHLEQSYGLTINHNDYVVSYEYFADNVMPSVVVTPK